MVQKKIRSCRDGSAEQSPLPTHTVSCGFSLRDFIGISWLLVVWMDNRDRVLLCSPMWSQIYDPPASVLGFRYVPQALSLTQFCFRTRHSRSKLFMKYGCFLSPNFCGDKTITWFQFSNGDASMSNCPELESGLSGLTQEPSLEVLLWFSTLRSK